MLQLVADVMKEGWQQHNPIKPYLRQEWATSKGGTIPWNSSQYSIATTTTTGARA
jgi:beta-xylosidase